MNRRWGLRYIPIGVLAVVVLAVMIANTAAAQFFGGGWGGGPDLEVSARFDADKNGYLDKSERKAAFQALTGGTHNGGRDSQSQATTIRNAKLTPAQVESYPGRPLYDPGTLRTMFLNFEDSDWEAQMTAYKDTDIEMPATAIVDGQTYRQVGVQFRGQTSFRMVPEGYKRSLKISFDFLDKKQQLLGYDSLHLLNSAGDPTFLRTVLYMQIARDYIAAPRANYMRVVINGENWGIYVNSQPFNGKFVKEATGAGGARWKVPGSPRSRGGLEYFGDRPDDYRAVFEIKSKDKPESWAALINLTKVLNQTPPDKLEAALEPILDIDGVLRFMALDNALINNDGYWVRASDYNLYQDKSGKFHVTPHDVNESMRAVGRMSRRSGNDGAALSAVALDPLIGEHDPVKPLLSKLLAVPALKQRYLDYVRDIAVKWLDWSRLAPIASQYQALIAADIGQDQRKLYSTAAFSANVTQDGGSNEGWGMLSPPSLSLKSFVQQRRAYLLNYFAAGSGAERTGT